MTLSLWGKSAVVLAFEEDELVYQSGQHRSDGRPQPVDPMVGPDIGDDGRAERARRVVNSLFEHYMAHPEAITSDFTRPDDPPIRRTADYIAGMTDHFALRTAEELGLKV